MHLAHIVQRRAVIPFRLFEPATVPGGRRRRQDRDAADEAVPPVSLGNRRRVKGLLG